MKKRNSLPANAGPGRGERVKRRNFPLAYSRAERKKILQILWKNLPLLLVLLLLGTALFAGIRAALSEVGKRNPIHVAVICEDSSEGELIRKVTAVLENEESISGVCRFVYESREDAEKDLRSGGVQAEVILGDSFVSDLMTGGNTPAEIRIPENSGWNTEEFRELVRDGTSLIRTGEAAIYSAEQMAASGGGISDRGELDDKLTKVFLHAAFRRGNFFGEELLSVFGEQNIGEYYFAAALCLFLVLTGLIFAGLYSGEDKVVRRCLRREGVSCVAAGSVRVLHMGLVLLCEALLLLFAAAGGAVFLRLSFAPALSRLPIRILCLFILCLGISGFFHAVYAAAGDARHGALLLLILTFFMVLVSGILLPQAFLPKAAAAVGNVLLMRFWRAFLVECLYGNPSRSHAALILVIGLACSVIGVLCDEARSRWYLAGGRPEEKKEARRSWFPATRGFAESGGAFGIFLRRELRRPLCCVILAAMVLIPFLYRSLTLPRQENHLILLYQEPEGREQESSSEADRYSGNALIDALLRENETGESAFSFQRAESLEELRNRVLSSGASCGFVIPSDYEERLKAGDFSSLVTFVGSGYTTNGETAKETIFAAMYRQAAPVLLAQNAEEIFGRSDEEFMTGLTEQYDLLTDSEELFHVTFENAEGAAAPVTEKNPAVQLWLLSAILLFASVLLLGCEGYFGGMRSLEQALPRYLRKRVVLTRLLAQSLPAAVVGLAAAAAAAAPAGGGLLVLTGISPGVLLLSCLLTRILYFRIPDAETYLGSCVCLIFSAAVLFAAVVRIFR